MKIISTILAISVSLACTGDSGAEPDWSRIYLGALPTIGRSDGVFAFEWNNHVWTADAKGGTARQVGHSGYEDTWPVMSPDGRRVAFMSKRAGGNGSIFAADLESGEVVRLSYDTEAATPRAWSADGSTVLCVGWRENVGLVSSMRIILLRADGSGVESIPFDVPATEPSLSPDGRRLLFTFRSGDVYRKRPKSKSSEAGEIWMYDFATGAFTRMTGGTDECRNAVWAPDGAGFYYLSAEGGVRNVWYSTPGGKPRRITSFSDDHVFQPSVSSDGRTMLFRQGFDFWRLDLSREGAAPERITLHPEPGYLERPPVQRRYYDACGNNDVGGDVSFCDNGSQIAFTAGGDLFVMDTVALEPRLVKGGTLTHERECVFSPDGKALYFTSDRGDGSSLVKAEPSDPSVPWWENTSFRLTTLVSDDEPRINLTISPDGSRLAWCDANGQLSFATTNGEVVARGPKSNNRGTYAWSPDAKWVAAEIMDSCRDTDVWIVSADGSAEPYNLSRNPGFDGHPAWSPDGEVVAFISTRPEHGSGQCLCYVYLDRALGEAEKDRGKLRKAREEIAGKTLEENRYAKIECASKPFAERGGIDFSDLADRVEVLNVKASAPFFSHDSRTIAYATGGRTDTVHVPDRLSGKKLFGKTGDFRAWTKKDDKVLWVVGNLPAHNEQTFAVSVYQNTDIADYQELAFRTAWARIRDKFYDPATHGCDWGAMREKYLGAARNATSWSVFARVMYMMLGELDASHLGFNATASSRREWGDPKRREGWSEVTARLGLRFDVHQGDEGWKVAEVVKGGPADRLDFGFRPGDVVTAIDGVPVGGGTCPGRVLNGNERRNVRVSYRSGTNETRTVTMKSATASDIRKLVDDEALREKRRRVHEASGGKLGYINVAAMDNENLNAFRRELYSEGIGRDGLVVDVRFNRGGFTANRMLQSLLGVDRTIYLPRGMNVGYMLDYNGAPLWWKPVVVLCSENSNSNAEIFSHAIKSSGRGKLVGRTTAGAVIATHDAALLDYGDFRNAHTGVFTPDGTDMENNGAQPDVPVDDTPADIASGVDVQLEKAIEVLGEEVREWNASHQDAKPRIYSFGAQD